MSLTVGEWQEVLRSRLDMSKVWGVSAPSYQHIATALGEFFSSSHAILIEHVCPDFQHEPFFPFFALLQTLQKKQNYDVANLLYNSNTYILHKPLFEAIYKEGVFHRDILFLEELNFERLRLEEALLKQLDILLQAQPVVWIIKDAHNLGQKSRTLIKNLHKKNVSHLHVFLLVSPSALQATAFIDFWEWCVHEGVAYDVSTTETESPSAPKHDVSPVSIFAEARILLNFLHFEEVISLLESVRQDIFLPANEMTYFFLKGVAHYYLQDFGQAIESFHNGLEQSFEIADESQSQNFQFYLALSYLGQSDIEQAYKHIYVVYHHYYSDSLSETFGYLFYYLLIAARYHGYWTNEMEQLIQQILAEADRWGFKNMKAYILGVYFIENIHAGFIESKQHLLLQICDEMTTIAESLGNEARLAAAYHNRAMVFSQVGGHENAFVYYQKSLDIKKRFQNPIELAQIRNGIAYGYMLAERYEQAIGFIQQNVTAMRSIGHMIEVMLSFVNAGITLVGTGQYEEAIEVFQAIEQMKHISGISSLPYHSSLELGCYLGLCYAQTHQSLKLFSLYQRVKTIAEQGGYSAYEDILWLLFQAYFLKEEKKTDALRNTLQKCLLVMLEYRPSLWLLWRHGFELFFATFPENSNERTAVQKILDRLSGQHLVSPDLMQIVKNLSPLQPVRFLWSREECLNVAYEYANLQKLEQNLVRMHFLRQIYSIMASTSLSTHLFQKILKVIATYLPVSSAFFLLLEDFHWHNAASLNDTRVFDPLFVIEKIFQEIGVDQKVVHLASQAYWQKLLPFEASLYIVPLRRRYTWEGALLLLWNANFPLSRENEEILAMLGEYLAVQVYYKRLLDNLKFLNYDISTGFYKGEEILQQIQRESARIERYGRKLRNFAVAYIMLENFFHFREKYGENITNFFLKRFRQQIERGVREVDIVGYMPEGGVVILFPESHAGSVEKFIQRLEAFFSHPIASMKDVRKLLPQEKSRQETVVSCHIGIVDYHSCPEPPETLMHIAKEMALRARGNATLKEVYQMKRP